MVRLAAKIWRQLPHTGTPRYGVWGFRVFGQRTHFESSNRSSMSIGFSRGLNYENQPPYSSATSHSSNLDSSIMAKGKFESDDMKALRYYGKEDIRLERIPIPVCGKNQIKLKPAFVGICGTDLHEYVHGPNLIPTTPHPITKEKAPLVVGHEFTGVVEEVGEDVHDIKPGQHVVVQPIIYDGTCGACKDGFINCCYQNGFIGVSGWGGGFSEHMTAPRDAVYVLPESIPMDIGALIEPLSVAWHAISISPFKEDDTILVLGGGPIGLAMLQCLIARGAKNVIVSEVAAQRQQYAKNFGAKHVFDPTKVDVVQECRDLTNGYGVDLVFDCAGVQVGLDAGVQALRARGTLVNVAVWGRKATILPDAFVFREKRYMGTATFVRGDFPAVIDALATGKLNPRNMITSKIKLDDIEEHGYKALINEKDRHVKIMVDMSAQA